MPKVIAHAGWITLLLLASSSADARIICREGFQMSGGQEISTPYCNDNYVAEVARKYGVRVSNEEIRNNPNRKEEVCRFIGYDTRVRDYCNTDSNSSRSGK